MGWLFIQSATRADIIYRCIRTISNDDTRWTTIAHCTKGNVLWAVVEAVRKDTGEAERAIICYLIAPRKAYGWGYKDIPECMGPFYYSCPLAYLDLAPEANAAWRQLVRDWHARMARVVRVGETWSLIGCKIGMVDITSVRPLRGRGREDGVLYRIPRRLLGERLDQQRLSSASTKLPVPVSAQQTA